MTAEQEALAFEVTTPGVYDAIPNDVYHADPVPAGSLSCSGAKKLLPPSCPALFKWEREHPVHKNVFDIGHAAHALVLGDFVTTITIIEAENYMTRAAREAKAAAYEAGIVPVLRHEYEQVEMMAAQILANPIAARLFAPGTGKPEQSMFWVDQLSGVWLRRRLDWLPNKGRGRMILADYKTSHSADPKTFLKSAANFGYHQDAAWSIDAVKVLGLDDDPAFVLVVQDKNPPYVVTVIELDEVAVNIGRNLNGGAIQRYAECVATGRWPGYSDEVVLGALPNWYVRDYDEEPL